MAHESEIVEAEKALRALLRDVARAGAVEAPDDKNCSGFSDLDVERIAERVLGSRSEEIADFLSAHVLSGPAPEHRGDGEAVARAIRDAYSCGYSAGCAGATESVRVSDLEGLIAAHPTPPASAAVYDQAAAICMDRSRRFRHGPGTDDAIILAREDEARGCAKAILAAKEPA